jgi:hypothetical protein
MCARKQIRACLGPVDRNSSGRCNSATIGDQHHVRCHDVHELLQVSGSQCGEEALYDCLLLRRAHLEPRPPSRHMLACPKGDLSHRGLDFPAAGAISACGISKTWWSTNTARSMGASVSSTVNSRDRDALRELDILGEHRGS